MPSDAPVQRQSIGVKQVGRLGGSSKYSEPTIQNLAQDPSAVVQTGPGVPRWSWNTEELIWNGAVTRDHFFSLWLLPPAVVRLLEVLRAERILVTAPGWEVSGVGREGRLEGALTFTRRNRESTSSAGTAPEAPSLPPWLTLTREVELGVNWVVRNRLVREASADVPVEGGSVLASFPRGQTELVWTSTLEPRERLVLSAARSANYAETWSLDCGFVWHCKPSGLAPVRHDLDQRWRPLWRPFAGETVEIGVSRPRPLPVPGVSKTILGAALRITPGERLTRSELTFQVRSSSGGTQRVTLPDGAVLQELSVDLEARASRLDRGAIAICLNACLLLKRAPDAVARLSAVPFRA